MKTYENILQNYIKDNYKDRFLPSYALSYRYPKDFRYKVKLSKKHWFWSYAVSKETSNEIIQEKYLYSQLKNDVSILCKDIGEPVEKICRRFLEKPNSFSFKWKGTKTVYKFLDKDTDTVFTLKALVSDVDENSNFVYEYEFSCSKDFPINILETNILTLCLRELYEGHFREKEKEERLEKIKAARESMVNTYKNL